MNLQIQSSTLLLMFVSGLSLGLLFDWCKAIRAEFRLSSWAVSILDLVYWLAATVFIFWVLYQANYGELRAFVFLGLLIGVCCYFALFSRRSYRIARAVMKFSRVVARWIVRMIRVLIVRPLFFLYHLLQSVIIFFITASMFIFNFVVKLLYTLYLIVIRLFKRS